MGDAGQGVVAAAAGRALATCLVGVALGVWWEAYRGHLRAARPRGLALVVRDLLFWTGATLVAAFGLYFANWLDLRLYAVAGMALGVVAASALAGPEVRAVAGALTYAFGAVGRLTRLPFDRLRRRRPAAEGVRRGGGRRRPRGGGEPAA
ncbi:MAG: spore cortex biosynthesis protein YabQ [Firmicutes bacterium]|nr:spore cortex biosynthesis protein YabQ [Bacillota bacterium]